MARYLEIRLGYFEKRVRYFFLERIRLSFERSWLSQEWTRNAFEWKRNAFERTRNGFHGAEKCESGQHSTQMRKNPFIYRCFKGSTPTPTLTPTPNHHPPRDSTTHIVSRSIWSLYLSKNLFLWSPTIIGVIEFYLLRSSKKFYKIYSARHPVRVTLA